MSLIIVGQYVKIVDHSHTGDDEVLDYRLILKRSTNQRFDHSAYMVVSLLGGFWALWIKLARLVRAERAREDRERTGREHREIVRVWTKSQKGNKALNERSYK